MRCRITTQEKLKDLRIEKGLTLDELAKETGISKSTLGYYESDLGKDISNANLVALARYYEISTDYLLGLTDVRESSLKDVDALGFDDATLWASSVYV